jgi:MioC protein
MRTHDFSKKIQSANYAFEVVDDDKAQMTGYGKGIKVGDYILLTKDKVRYQVEEIEYYSNPRDCWTALLSKA